MTDNKASMARTDIFLLCETLKKKIAAFMKLNAETEFMNNSIRQQNTESIETSLARQRDHMCHIEMLDKEMLMIKERNPSLENMISPELRKQLEALKMTLADIIDETITLNKECEMTTGNMLQALLNDISSIDLRHKSIQNYKEKSGEPKFLEVKT